MGDTRFRDIKMAPLLRLRRLALDERKEEEEGERPREPPSAAAAHSPLAAGPT